MNINLYYYFEQPLCCWDYLFIFIIAYAAQQVRLCIIIKTISHSIGYDLSRAHCTERSKRFVKRVKS